MRNLIFTICFFGAHFSSAQDSTIFAPPGALWHYRPWTPGPDTGLYTFTAAGDTLLGGWNARVLRCSVWSNGALQAADQLNKYVAASGNKVYYRVADEFVLLFDFGAAPGDTLVSKVEAFPLFNGCVGPEGTEVWEFRYRIDSLGITNIDGVDLRVQFVSAVAGDNPVDWYVSGFSGQIVERIGALHAGYWWGQGGACILAGFPGYLRCYTDNMLHYGNPAIGSDACGFVSAAEPVFIPLNIHPNPADSRVQLPFVPDGVRVFNLLGQNAPVSQNGAMLDVSALPPGLYLMLADSAGRRYRGVLRVIRNSH